MNPQEKQTILAHQRTAPIDITALATGLGLSVYESYNLPRGISGKISRSEQSESASRFSISVNAHDSFYRRRFTIAHECAHYLLHRSQIGDEVSDNGMYRSEKLTSQDEFDANNLAADLLMPRHLVDQYVKQGNSGAASLAELFKVSEPAMRVRLRYLYWQDENIA
jgi:hypothetical protein